MADTFERARLVDSVSFVVVTFNSMGTLPACLDSIRNQSFPAEQIIVVDNGSQDGTLDYLRSQSDIELITNRENLGFAAANNQGIRASRGDGIFLLNADARLEPECLETMLCSTLLSGSISPKVLLDPSGLLDSTGIVLNKWRMCPVERGHLEEDREQYDEECDPEELIGPSAAAALYMKQALNSVSVGGEIFDEDFFAYYEDVDLAWRLKRAYWMTVYVPEAIAWHQRKGPEGKPRSLQIRANANRYLCFLKNASAKDLPVLLTIGVLWEVGRLARMLFRKPWMIESLWVFLKNVRRTWWKRKRVALRED